MKKFLAILLAFAMVLSMGACGSKEESKCDHEGYTGIKQITNQQGKVVYLEYTCSKCGETWTIDAKDCKHERKFANNITQYIDGNSVSIGQRYTCKDCLTTWNEYNEEYKAKLLQYDSYVHEHSYVHENSTTKSICPKCQKTCPDGCLNPRYCPYCKFDRIAGTTLTSSKLEKLIGAEPEIVKEACKTCGDVVAYMKASKMYNYTYIGREFKKYNRYDFEIDGYEAIKENVYPNCTGKTNLFNYLLEGDYDDQGILGMHMSIKPESRRPGNGGNHFIAYFKLGNKFYTTDINDGGSTSYKWNLIFMELDNLESFIESSKESQTCNYTNKFGVKEFLLVYYYNVIGDTCRYAPFITRWIDEDKNNIQINITDVLKNHLTIVYQKDEMNTINYVNVNCDIPGWNCPVE